MVGFDDIFAADVCTPGLTTLGGAHVDVGRAAVELLLTAGARAPPDDQPQVVLPTELVLRGSTGTASGPDLAWVVSRLGAGAPRTSTSEPVVEVRRPPGLSLEATGVGG